VVSIEGIYVTEASGRWLVDRLRSVGRADDVITACAIEAAVDADDDLTGLDDAERGAIVTALDGCPTHALAQLREALRD
jgi:uncharacterized metal-binding protein